MLHAVFLPSVWGIILLIWGIEMTDGKTYHQPYSTTSHYTCSLTLTDDETTHITISTSTSGVAFATSPDDALAQTITSNEYSKSSYAELCPKVGDGDFRRRV